MRKVDILLVGQTPPPFHGQAVVTEMLFDHEWGDLKVERLRMAYSDSIDDVGKARIGKLLQLLSMIWRTWMVVLKVRPQVLYYLPASPNLAPVVRDILYLAAVRWMFPKTVFHYHAGGLDEFVRGKLYLRLCAKWVYKYADSSVDVNVTNPPSGAYFEAKDNFVVMNGLDVVEVGRGRDVGAVFRVLYVGLVCEDKGVVGLIASAVILKKLDVCFEFVMVGGWESKELELEFHSKLLDAGVEDYFVFEGVLKGERKWQAYADADVFIFATHHPTETFGLVLIEAMAFSLPIVTTRWRGVPHVIGDSGCAILCDIKSPEQYADAIVSLIKNPSKRKQMGVLAREHYMANYTRKIFIERMESVFRDVLR